MLQHIRLGKQSLVQTIERLAHESHTTPAAWATEVLEDYILEHRSGRYRPDPDRFTERHDEQTIDEYHLDPYLVEE